MNSTPLFNLPVDDGLSLVLSTTPPDAGLFQIVFLGQGRVFWRQGDRLEAFDGPGLWWVGRSHGKWEPGPDAVEWFWIAGSTCPVPGWETDFAQALGLAGPQRLPGLLAEARELRDLATNCRYPCELRNLLARGKSLMVVSRVLLALKAELPRPVYDVRFFLDDLDRVRRAREVLLERMTSPPTLGQLAREVGINELKLKAGFQKLWGTTVFGVLRQERLVVARRLIESGECNVSGAAFRVGYTNTSHFARSFLSHFGVSPGGLARALR